MLVCLVSNYLGNTRQELCTYSIDLLQLSHKEVLHACQVMSMSLCLLQTADTMTSTANPLDRLMFLNMTDAVKLHRILVSCFATSAQAQYDALIVTYY